MCEVAAETREQNVFCKLLLVIVLESYSRCQ